MTMITEQTRLHAATMSPSPERALRRVAVPAIAAQTPSAVMNGRGDELVDPAVSNLWL